MTAPTQPQAGGYTLTPAALRDAGLIGIAVQDISRALRNPTDKRPLPLSGDRCSTIGAYTTDKKIRLVLDPLASTIERVCRA